MKSDFQEYKCMILTPRKKKKEEKKKLYARFLSLPSLCHVQKKKKNPKICKFMEINAQTSNLFIFTGIALWCSV